MQSPPSLYGRELTETPPWGRPSVVHVAYDPVTGVPTYLSGGGIHVREICPTIDTLTEANAGDIAYTFLRDNAHFLGVDPTELRLSRVREFMMASRNGREVFVMFNQVRNGVPVFGGTVRLSFKLNFLYSYQSDYVRTTVETIPTLSAAEAFAVAAPTQEAHLDSIGYPGAELRCQSAKLMIDVRRSSSTTPNRPPRLVWELQCCPSWEPGSSLILVAEAHTGKLIRSYRDAIVCFPAVNPGYRLEIPEAGEE
jgi:hypothetical protein